MHPFDLSQDHSGNQEVQNHSDSDEILRVQKRPNKYGPKDMDSSGELSSVIGSDSSFEHKMQLLDEDKIIEMAANV